MNIFPAIDLYGGKAVRLFKGDYSQMTVYSDNPVEIALDFKRRGASFIHIVDLEGAKTGETPNLEVIRKIEVIEKYLGIGVDRVILGTAALTDRAFLTEAVEGFGERIAVGVDIKDGKVAIKGWTEKSDKDALEFCRELDSLGVKTIICTDISKDGAMQGTNHPLYKTLSEEVGLDIIASGGVSSIEDVKRLRQINIYGAIIGKAYYTKAINLSEACEVAK